MEKVLDMGCSIRSSVSTTSTGMCCSTFQASCAATTKNASGTAAQMWVSAGGRVWDSPQFKGVTANLGVLNTFRLNDWLDANLDIRYMTTGEGFDGAWGSAEHDGVLSATVGLTYKFKRRGWDRSKTVYRYDYGDLESMRNKLNEMNAENERLKKELAQGKMAAARETVKRIASANLVTFPIGKSKLSNEARVNLGMLAEVIKSCDKNAIYTITGYSDAGTGSKRINEQLSKARAQACMTAWSKSSALSRPSLTWTTRVA